MQPVQRSDTAYPPSNKKSHLDTAPRVVGMTTNRDSLQLVNTNDGSATLKTLEHSETYHSNFGAITESREVFVKNSGIFHRLQNQQPSSILEIGFGTGLNFLLTAAVSRECNCRLAYEALEYNPPPVSLSTALLRQNLPGQATVIESLARHLENLGLAEQPPLTIEQTITLNLRLEDARQAVLTNQHFDAIYLDAFSSKTNPDLWTAKFLGKLHAALKPAGKLATYSVNRTFRDALQEAGFIWEKRKGPPGKREVLIAYREKPF